MNNNKICCIGVFNLSKLLASWFLGKHLTGNKEFELFPNEVCSLQSVLLVRFELGDSLLLAPAGADKGGPKAPFPLVENVGIQPAIRKRVPAGAPGFQPGLTESTVELKMSRENSFVGSSC